MLTKIIKPEALNILDELEIKNLIYIIKKILNSSDGTTSPFSYNTPSPGMRIGPHPNELKKKVEKLLDNVK